MITSKHDKVNIFVDLKNCLNGLYFEDNLRLLYINNINNRGPKGDVLLSWIQFLKFHYTYMYKKQKPIRLYFFAETGKSSYHKSLLSEYKDNRLLSDMKAFSAFEDDFIRKLIKSNIESGFKLMDKMFMCYGVYLKFFEADFVPHYVIDDQYKEKEDTVNIIYSNDDDMIQTLKFPNTILFKRRNKDNKKFITSKNWHECIKLDKSDIDVSNYIYMKALNGDTGDGIPGIKGLGYKTISKIFDGKTKIENPDQFKEFLLSLKLPRYTKVAEEQWDIIERNLKLMDFDIIKENIPLDYKCQLLDLHDHDSKKLSFADSAALIDKLINELSDGLC